MQLDAMVETALLSWRKATERFPNAYRLFYQNLSSDPLLKKQLPLKESESEAKELWDTIGALLGGLTSGSAGMNRAVTLYSKLGVTPSTYKVFGNSIVITLQTVLQVEFTPDIHECWLFVWLKFMRSTGPSESSGVAAEESQVLVRLWQSIYTKKRLAEFITKLWKEKVVIDEATATQIWNEIELSVYVTASGGTKTLSEIGKSVKTRYNLPDDSYAEIFGRIETVLESVSENRAAWEESKSYWREIVGRIMAGWGIGSKADALFYSGDFAEMQRVAIEVWELAIKINPHSYKIFYNKVLESEICKSIFSKSNIDHVGIKMWGMLGDTVKSLKNWQDVRMELRSLGRIHSSYYGVRAAMYDVLRNALQYTLQEVLKDRYTASAGQAWLSVYTYMQLEMTKEEQYNSPLHSNISGAAFEFKKVTYAQPTPEQIARVVGSWEKVRNTNGHQILYQKLQATEKTRHLFSSKDITTLGAQLWRMIGFTIRSLKSFDKLKSILRDLGVRHTEYYGVTEEMYDIFRDCLLGVLSELCQSDWSQDLADAWVNVYGLLCTEMLGNGTISNSAPDSVVTVDSEERRIEIMSSTLETANFQSPDCHMIFRDHLLASKHKWFIGMKSTDQMWAHLWKKAESVLDLCKDTTSKTALREMGDKHFEVYGVTYELYDIFFNAFTKTLNDVLIGKLTEVDKRAWHWGYYKVAEEMRRHTKDAISKSNSVNVTDVNFFDVPFPDFKQIGIAIRTWNTAVKKSPDSYKMFYRKVLEDERCKIIFDTSQKSMDGLGKKLWNMIGYCLKTMANFSKLKPILEELGKRHSQYYRVTPEMYFVSGNALLSTLSVILKEEWDDKMRDAWVNVYGALCSSMAKEEWLSSGKDIPDSPSASLIRASSSIVSNAIVDKTTIDVACQIWDRLQKVAANPGKTFFLKLMEDELCNSVFTKKDENGGKKLWNMLIFSLKNIKKNYSKVRLELVELGKKHLLVYGVTTQMYTTLGKAIVYTFETHLGSEWDERTKNAWCTLYNEISDEMKKGADSVYQYKPDFAHAEYPSEAQITLCQKAWPKVSNINKGLYRILAECEQSKSILSHVNIEVLGKKFMYMIDFTVKKMNNFSALKVSLNKLGVQHSVVYGVTPAMYREFGESFLRVLRFALNSTWNHKLEEAWGNVYFALSSEMQRMVKRGRFSQVADDPDSIDAYHLTVVTEFWERVNRVAPESYRTFMVRLAANEQCRPVLNVKNLAAQGKKLWNMLGYTIGHMKNFKVLEPMLNELGAKHCFQYGVTEEMYRLLEVALQETLESILKDEWAKASAAFHHVYRKMSNAMLDGARNAQKGKTEEMKPNELHLKLAIKTFDTAKRLQPNCPTILVTKLMAIEEMSRVYKDRLEAQAENIWGMISYSIRHMDDYEATKQQLRVLGHKHASIYGVTEGMYLKMKLALFATLSESLEGMWSSVVEQAWDAVYTSITSPMIKGASGSYGVLPIGRSGSLGRAESSSVSLKEGLPEMLRIAPTWERINSLNPNTHEILLGKLTQHPDTRRAFEKKNLSSVGKKFWNVMGYTVETMKTHGMQKVKNILKEVGKRHATLYGVTPSMYDSFKKIFMQTLKEVLKGEWGQEEEADWGHLIDLMIIEMNARDIGAVSVSPTESVASVELEAATLKPEYVMECIETWALALKLNPNGYIVFYERVKLDDLCLQILIKRNVDDLGKKIWNMIGYTVRNLAKFNEMRQTLRGLGQKHSALYGVTPPMYDILGEALTYSLQNIIGDRWTTQSRMAWDTVYTALASEMLAGVSGKRQSFAFPGQRQTVSQIISEIKSVNMCQAIFQRVSDLDSDIAYKFYLKFIENEDCAALFPDKSVIEATAKHTWNMLHFLINGMKNGSAELEVKMAELGMKHRNFFGTTREMYIVFGGAWLSSLSDTLQGDWSASEKEACAVVYANITNSMLRGAGETEEFSHISVMDYFNLITKLDMVTATWKDMNEKFPNIHSKFTDKLVEAGLTAPNDNAEALRLWIALGDAVGRQGSHGIMGIQVDEISHLNNAMRQTLQEEFGSVWEKELFIAWDTALGAFLQRSLDTVLYAEDVSLSRGSSLFQFVAPRVDRHQENTPDIVKVYTSWTACQSINPNAYIMFIEFLHTSQLRFDCFVGKSMAVEGAAIWRIVEEALRQGVTSKRPVTNLALAWHRYCDGLTQEVCDLFTGALIHTVSKVLDTKWTADINAAWLRVYLSQIRSSSEGSSNE